MEIFLNAYYKFNFNDYIYKKMFNEVTAINFIGYPKNYGNNP